MCSNDGICGKGWWLMKNMQSRKGFTLVELIVAVAFTAVIITAACSMLYLGANSFKISTANAFNQQKAVLAETYLQKYASTAYTLSSANAGTDGGIIFTLTGSTLNISKQTVTDGAKTVGPVASIDGIGQIGLKIENGSLNYTIMSSDTTYTLRGGIVMNNFKGGAVGNLTGNNTIVLFLGTVPS
jgi:prepilin-type N-terminal cleavage/methylation domain-containing protein